MDSKTYLNGIKNDLKTAIDDIFEILINLREDVEKLRTHPVKKSDCHCE